MTAKRVCVSFMCLINLLVAGSWLDAVAGEPPADLAIGVPNEDIAAAVDAGAVSVLYGTPTGLDDDGNQYWIQDRFPVGSSSEPEDRFGAALAVGDFDGDGIYDLAVGVPMEGSVSRNHASGAVNVIYGARPDGLETTPDQYWDQDTPELTDSAELYDRFGDSLAAGDFNGDGFDDLAVGVPGEDIDTTENAGAVHVLHGSSSGLQADDDTLWSQSMAGSTSEYDDFFGKVVASGDFDNDGYDDLAIGVPKEDLVDITDSGAVNVLYGSSTGLVARAGNHFWHQDRAEMPGDAERYDNFGHALAVGDYDGDGYDDLAIGVPQEDLGDPDILDAGCVHVLNGSPAGLDAANSGFLHQDSPNIGSIPEAYDRFGDVLAAGDFNGTGYDDLAIGLPDEDWNQQRTGIVQVVWGSDMGLAGPDELWRQDLLDNFGLDEEDDQFGHALAAGDFDGDGYDELAVSAPFKNLFSTYGVGVVYVLRGTAGGLSSDNQWWYQGKDGVLGAIENSDYFGRSLVAIPGPTLLFSDGFESGGTGTWSMTSP